MGLILPVLFLGLMAACRLQSSCSSWCWGRRGRVNALGFLFGGVSR